MRKLFNALVLGLCAWSALAGTLEEGLRASNSGDYTTALRLWRSLADQGDAIAQFSLALMYDTGQGVLQDYAEAMKWYRKSADQGHAGAQFNLALMHDEGQGVPQDYVEAHQWYNLSAARATEKDQRDIAIQQRDRIAAIMTPVQVAEAQKLAREWIPTQR